MKTQLGVIGNPISHSLSPLMHTAALNACGLTNWRYDAYCVEDLPAFVQNSRNTLRGYNVTIPHKQAIMPLLDHLDISAQHANAVNTVVNTQGTLTGFNTDGYGFMVPLETMDLTGKTALIMGAGGAAIAIAASLMTRNLDQLVIINRTLKNAHHIVTTCQSISATTLHTDTNPSAYLGDSSLVINTTPIGMTGHNSRPLFDTFDWVTPTHTCYDIIYTPATTPFLYEAKKRGAHIINGLAMFIYQGAKAFDYFTNTTAPTDIMTRAVLAKLG